MGEEAPAGIYARESVYLERFVQIGIVATRVINVAFPARPAPDADDDHPVLDRLERYLDGARETFEDVEIALTVPTDHRLVYDTVRAVPYGVQRDVETIARATPGLDVDDGGSVVRAALGNNPLPILVPDHRVLDGPSGAPDDVVDRLRALEGL